jgi:hypothetical protein
MPKHFSAVVSLGPPVTGVLFVFSIPAVVWGSAVVGVLLTNLLLGESYQVRHVGG